jgi:nucleotide-binding universal stress UspA family protein
MFSRKKEKAMIKKIVAATDGSPVSRKAVNFAAGLAKQLGASLTLLGVIDIDYLFATQLPPPVSTANIRESTEDVLRQAIEAYLDEALTDCRKKNLDVSKVIRKGHPVEEIVKEAESEQADVIVLGSHGRSALKAAVLGSVAYGVLHKDSRFPVLVVRR